MFKVGIASIFILFGFWQLAQKPHHLPETHFTDSSNTGKVAHTPWNVLLQKHVDTDGNVNYKNFLKDKQALQDYLDYLAKNEPQKNWSKAEGLAYYINLYNAATVLLILEHYPLESIKDINSPWGKEWVAIGSKTYSLGDIEHKILRKMDEPRIHFAINCASYSCPKLWNKAFTAADLESQLTAVTKDFVSDTKRNSIAEKEVGLSNIFKWYKKDFTENGSLTDYINKYSKTKISADANISYLKYDWSLNESK